MAKPFKDGCLKQKLESGSSKSEPHDSEHTLRVVLVEGKEMYYKADKLTDY